VQVYTEVSPHGQGTATTFAQIAADALGVRPEDVQVLHSDTALLASGQGTFASRGLSVGGSAVYAGLQQARQTMARLAAHLLDCWVEDVVFWEGKVYNDRNPAQVMTFAEVAAAAQQPDRLPSELATGLEFPVTFTLHDNPYGFGVHVAVVEVDRDTGALTLRRYVAVNDCGRVINPKLLEGQVYGAIAQGLGQALGEGMHYSEAGQPLTGSLLDYPLPHAKDVLEIRTATMQTLSPTNALGLKGIGELPTVACPVALVNAAMDALSDANVQHLDAPLTMEKLWRALHGAG
jgi:carbon-monoxide dehydrogenase large subunit